MGHRPPGEKHIPRLMSIFKVCIKNRRNKPRKGVIFFYYVIGGGLEQCNLEENVNMALSDTKLTDWYT